MSKCDSYNSTADALGNFSGSAPLDAITCTFSADWGLGLGPVFGLFVFGVMGVALTVRTRHPGPVTIAGILSAGLVATSIPGIAAKIMAFVLFVAFAGAGMMIYQRAQSSL